MPYTNLTFPGTVTSETTGDVAWSNPTNITADDTNYATATLTTGQDTEKLRATNFGFSLPTESSVTDIFVRVKVKSDITEEIQFQGISLVYNGAVIGDTYKNGVYVYDSEAIFIISEGIWNYNLDYGTVNDSTFGVEVSFEDQNITTSATVSVNSIQVNVNYTLSSLYSSVEDVNNLSVDNLVELYRIDFSPIGYNEVLYITPYTEGQGASVDFNGISYTPIPMSTSGFGWDGKAALPTPSITLSNVLNTFSAINVTYGNMLGVQVQRIQTFAKYLDNGSSPDPNAKLPLDTYYISQKVNQNELTVEYKLTSIVDLEGIKLPRGKYYKDSCIYQYRRPLKDINSEFIGFDYGRRTTCPYAGGEFYDINGESVTEPLEDVCSYRLETGCIPRFGEDSELPFKAFPGLSDNPT